MQMGGVREDHEEQYRRSCKPCSVIEDELPSDGRLELWRCGQTLPLEDILDERREYAGTGAERKERRAQRST